MPTSNPSAAPNHPTAKPPRRRSQFSLRTLLLATTLIAVALTIAITPRIRRHAVVARLEGATRGIYYSEIPADESWPTRTLRKYLPRDWFDDVIRVRGSATTSDSDLVGIESLTQLRQLSLEGTQVTDAGLVHLKDLAKLQTVWLDRTQIAGAGLAHLNNLPQLQGLSLDGTQVTDAGLVHLRGLAQLQWLVLDAMQVTAEGAAELQTALPECRIIGP